MTIKSITRLKTDLLRNIEKKLFIVNAEDWYKVSLISFKKTYLSEAKKTDTVKSNQSTQENLTDLLKVAYPQKYWKKWLFHYHLSTEFWENKVNQRSCFYDAFEKQNIKYLDQLYTESKKFLKLLTGGSSFLSRTYSNSLSKAVIDLFPEYGASLKLWKFDKTMKGFWDSLDNQRSFFNDLEKKLQIKDKKDWYNISINTILQNGGFLPYSKYNSIFLLLQTIYPNYIWSPWKFNNSPKKWWSEKGEKSYFRCRQFFDFESKNLEITTPIDFYSLNYLNLPKSGITILKKYKSSKIICFTELYPEIINFFPWSIESIKLSSKFWEKNQHCLQFLNWCENYFSIESKYDWHYITNFQFRKIGGNYLLKKFKNLFNILNFYFPNIEWNESIMISKTKSKKNQNQLFKILKKKFKKEKILQNFTHKNLVFPKTNKKIEFDIFIPSLNLAFEYQGKQHFEWTYFNGNPKDQKKRDLEKKNISKNNFITLIEIPYSWSQENSLQKQKKYLFDMIISERPDINSIVNSS